MQNPDSTITDGHCSKSKSEVDPDSNSTPKVDFKKILLRARYAHSRRGSYEGLPPPSLVNKRTPKPNDTGDERSDPKSLRLTPVFSPFFRWSFFFFFLIFYFFGAQATFCLKDRVKSKK